jgi:hypothetical protein
MFFVLSRLPLAKAATAESFVSFYPCIQRLMQCFDICKMKRLDGCVLWIYSYVVFRI